MEGEAVLQYMFVFLKSCFVMFKIICFPNICVFFHFRWRLTFYLGIFIYAIRHLWVVS